MNDRELLIFLHTLNGVGWKTISKLSTNLNSLNLIPSMQASKLSMKTGISIAIAEKIVDKLKESNYMYFIRQLEEWTSMGINIITYLDKDYPDMLKEIAMPPWVIFTKGKTALLNKPSIAIVGTRNPTSYGKLVTEKLAKDLVDYNFIITSGMARGIDRIAHEGALMNEGETIAVLGSGIDIIYPKEHIKLYENIINHGLVITEYPPGTQPHPGFFPQRNRIISGLSYGAIIVEASLKSGSLITAQHALEQSREVFAVPGPITSKQSIGTNSLIQQGAKLVKNSDDIIEEFPYLTLNKNKKNNIEVKLSNTEYKVYDLIKYTPIHIDEIYQKSSLNLNDIYECLLSLQLKKKVRQIPGSLYIRQT